MLHQHDKINIRPQVNILSVLKYLEYESWYALAEFVDNAIASYLEYEKELKMAEGDEFKFEVNIEIDEIRNKITIRDNAAGIQPKDFHRAFRAAEAPPDTSGLSEFGMGMKSAACWFSDTWNVRTAALGEGTEKIVQFDMKKIFEDKLEELDVTIKATNPNYHYTIIELYNVDKIPKKKGLWKVKEHLKSIYRDFIRKGILTLKVDNEELHYQEPKILKAPKFDDPKGEPILWKKEINFPIENGLSVHGFVAIRETGSTSEAGFALFRRGRVIEGSYDNGFRPERIFGASNSYRYQRIFGELHLEGFEVVFTKKGIKWDENLDMFLELLRDDINHDSFPLLQQAEKHRVRASEKEYQTSAKKVFKQISTNIEEKAPQIVIEIINKPKIQEEQPKTLTITKKIIHHEFEIRFNTILWKISLELSYDPSLKDLIEIGDHLIPQKSNDTSIRQIGIRLSLTHPFMVEYAGIDNSKIEPILYIITALGLSEVIAKESGAKTQSEIRRNFNEIISKLSKVE